MTGCRVVQGQAIRSQIHSSQIDDGAVQGGIARQGGITGIGLRRRGGDVAANLRCFGHRNRLRRSNFCGSFKGAVGRNVAHCCTATCHPVQLQFANGGSGAVHTDREAVPIFIAQTGPA